MSSDTPATEAATVQRVQPRGGSPWREGRLLDAHHETATARTLILRVPGWPGHLPGQHVDVRLTAEDGYSAVRSYSLAAPANGDRVVLTVEGLPDGEVSPYLVGEFAVGDVVEIRGPIGGWFVWRPDQREPLLLVAGGSGIVPLMAILRAHAAAPDAGPAQLLYSVRSADQIYYRDELTRLGDDDGCAPVLLYTRRVPDQSPRPAGRLTAADVTDLGLRHPGTTCYVCGPTGFVEHVAGILTAVGDDSRRIRTERFGPTRG